MSEELKGRIFRRIRTARSVELINESAKQGERPLIKKVQPSKKVFRSVVVFQSESTGEIHVTSQDNWRDMHLAGSEDSKLVLDHKYYPHYFQLPFAAYLIPEDLEVGERVFIEDLIEDYPGLTYQGGSTERLESCEAIWNGKDFEMQYDPERDRGHIVG